MVMVSKFSNFPDELSENDELREYELSGSDYNSKTIFHNYLMLLLERLCNTTAFLQEEAFERPRSKRGSSPPVPAVRTKMHSEGVGI